MSLPTALLTSFIAVVASGELINNKTINTLRCIPKIMGTVIIANAFIDAAERLRSD